MPPRVVSGWGRGLRWSERGHPGASSPAFRVAASSEGMASNHHFRRRSRRVIRPRVDAAGVDPFVRSIPHAADEGTTTDMSTLTTPPTAAATRPAKVPSATPSFWGAKLATTAFGEAFSDFIFFNDYIGQHPAILMDSAC